ncbi:hypothetical protein CV014_08525 [Nostoc sp. CMAA1605]|nr:hypothetical protein [Nostoc sp. CMAA1605]
MKKSKRQLKPGDKVEFPSYDEHCKPFTERGIVTVYVYPDFHPNGYIEIVDSDGNLILYGNAGEDIKKVK